jgi:hypothetical protein
MSDFDFEPGTAGIPTGASLDDLGKYIYVTDESQAAIFESFLATVADSEQKL